MNLEIIILSWVANKLGILKEYEELRKKLGNTLPRLTPYGTPMIPSPPRNLPKPPPSND